MPTVRLLEGLADWCDRYTPLVALDGSDGLLLDVTGCTHLFGGEQAMASDLVSRLYGFGFSVRIGLAATPGAAWAAARFTNAVVASTARRRRSGAHSGCRGRGGLSCRPAACRAADRPGNDCRA